MATKISSKAKSSVKKESKKQIKKKPWLIVVILFLVIGAVGGFFTAKVLTQNDTFEIVGDQTIYLEVGQTYQDEGVKIVSFGRDISQNVKSENNIDNTKEGEYYIKYTVEDIRFGNVCRYRYIIVQEVDDEG